MRWKENFASLACFGRWCFGITLTWLPSFAVFDAELASFAVFDAELSSLANFHDS